VLLFSPDLWFALTVLGLFLISLEFCFPGLVFPAAVGSVFALGGAWRLFHNGSWSGGPHAWVAVPLAALLVASIVTLLRIAAAGRARKRDFGKTPRISP
jgi:membrane-bound ClpP family serine protease